MNYNIGSAKSNYRRLGNYIEFIDSRALNHESKLDLDSIKGISSISKDFIKTKANLVGVVADNYKVVEKDSFAYNPNTARMGDRIPIALNQAATPVLVSSIYPTFKINNENDLLAEYLLMWFRRPEFDRYARFMSHGSAREVFDSDEMNGVMLPIPTITKQREIVKEYNVIQNHIALNQQLIQKLEETAQAIYREWFVEDLDLENLPEGWNTGKLSDLIEIKYGKAYSHLVEGEIPLYGSGGLMSKVNKALYTKPSVLIPRKGTLSNIMFINHPFWCVDTMFYSIFKNEINGYYSYYILKQLDFDAMNQGSAVPSMTTAFLNDIEVVLPNKDILKKFNEVLHKTISHKENIEKENQKLTELKDLLLSKLATVEN